LSKLNGEKYSVYLEVYGGGFGASAYGDGCDAVDSPLSNCTNTPVEATDMDFTHFRIIRYELIPDSCGHGMYRGGLGFLRSFLVLEDDVNFALYADRFTLSPYGLFGGTSGMRARCELSRNGSVTYLKSKDAAMLHKGDILTVYTAGGGGYGDAGDRPQRSVEEDLRQGFISPVAAEDNYSYFFRGIKTKSERGASIDD
jgi:N-methylhydantoinase B